MPDLGGELFDRLEFESLLFTAAQAVVEYSAVTVERPEFADGRESLGVGRGAVRPARGDGADHAVIEANEYLGRVLALHELQPVGAEHRGDLGRRTAGEV